MSSLSSLNIHSKSSPLPTKKSTLDIEKGVEGDLSEPSSLSAQVELNSRPPFLVKLTVYRLLTLSAIVLFGGAIPKALKSLERGEATATWFKWVLGVILGTMLYYLGLYESVQPPVAVWFFHTDLAPDLFYLPFGVVVITTYMEFYLWCFSHILKLLQPNPKRIEGFIRFFIFTSPLVILSWLAGMTLPLLAATVITWAILKLGGRRFRRKATNFFVTGYRNRFEARPIVYTLVTYPSICVIIFVIDRFQLAEENLGKHVKSKEEMETERELNHHYNTFYDT